MANYFQVLNETGTRVLIDDTYRYFYEIGTLDISTGINASTQFTNKHSGNGIYSNLDNTLDYQCYNSWQYCVEDTRLFRSSDTCKKYMATIVPVTSNRLYAIRFKRACTSDNIVSIRMFPTLLGADINNDDTIHSMLIEVFSTVKTFSVAQILNYFEIVELGNDNATIPPCYNGIQLYNASGEVIWNSNCKMVNISGAYSGTAGSVNINNFTTSNMLVMTSTYKDQDLKQRSSADWQAYIDRDAFCWDGSTLHNIKHRIWQTSQSASDAMSSGVYCWDGRDMSYNTININGLILRR